METLPLEQEFMLRATGHKLFMLGTFIKDEYIKSQTEGTNTIPQFIVEKQAPMVADERLKRILLEGKLNEEYEKAWEQVKDRLPDNFSCTL